MFQATPLPLFDDNYLWLLDNGRSLIAVDPGAIEPLSLALQRLPLQAVLITHRHADHVGGLPALLARQPDLAVYGPPSIAGVNRPLRDGDTLQLAGWPALQVLATPGHTLDHLSYLIGDWLFCGDTLFACGCGRLFDGSAAQLYASLQRLAALPPDTRIACSHEYTLSNQRFAAAAEPDNVALQQRRQRDEASRAAGQPTLPSTLALERATNPFLRCDQPGIRQRLQAAGWPADDSQSAFTSLRRWKDGF